MHTQALPQETSVTLQDFAAAVTALGMLHVCVCAFVCLTLQDFAAAVTALGMMHLHTHMHHTLFPSLIRHFMRYKSRCPVGEEIFLLFVFFLSV